VALDLSTQRIWLRDPAVKGVKRPRVGIGNRLKVDQSKKLPGASCLETIRGERDRAILALLAAFTKKYPFQKLFRLVIPCLCAEVAPAGHAPGKAPTREGALLLCQPLLEERDERRQRALRGLHKGHVSETRQQL